MRYTVDEFGRDETPEYRGVHASDDLPAVPIVVEVLGPDSSGWKNLVGAGDRVIGRGLTLGRTGREQLGLTSLDQDIEAKVNPLRSALRELMDEVEADLIPTLNGEPLDSPAEHAEHWQRSRFLHMLAYAALAAELECAIG